MGNRIRLREYAGNAGGLVVDRENGVIRGVKVLGATSLNSHGVGKVSGTDYPLETRKAACSLYEGCKVNVDHPSRATPGADRSALDRVGWLVGVTARPDGTFADLHLLKSDPFAAKLFEAAERNPSLFGLSHNALGEGEVRGDRYVVTSIPEVFSVDIVADAGSVRGLHESLLREEKDASGHEHAADGKFGSGGGSSGAKTSGNKTVKKGKKAAPAAPTKMGEEHVDELAGKLASAKHPHEVRQIMKTYSGKYDSGDATDALFDSGALHFDEDKEKIHVADPKKLKDLLTKHATGNKGDGHGYLKDSLKRRKPMAGKTLTEALESIGFKGKRVKKLLEMDGLDGAMPLDAQPSPPEPDGDEGQDDGGYEFHIGQLVLGILQDDTLDLKAKKAKIEQALDLIDDDTPAEVTPAIEGDDAMEGDDSSEDDPKETKESLRRRVKALEAREAIRALCEAEDFMPTKLQMKALVVLSESDRKAFIAEAKGSTKPATGDKGNANRNAPRTSVRESASKDASPDEIRARLFS